MTTKTKKTVKIIVDVVLWIFLVFALLMTILTISATANGEGVPNIGGKYILTVSSNSMSPEFKKGDIIIVRQLSDKDKNGLKVGDVITFYDREIEKTYNYQNALNTHRISDVAESNNTLYSVQTWGDNREICPGPDQTPRYADDILGIYEGTRIAGAGKLLTFLQQPTGFLVCIVLPLVLFFLYEIFVVIKTALGIKNAGKKVITASDEELIKQRAIEEYLKQQAAATEKTENGDAGQGGDTPSDGENPS